MVVWSKSLRNSEGDGPAVLQGCLTVDSTSGKGIQAKELLPSPPTPHTPYSCYIPEGWIIRTWMAEIPGMDLCMWL